MSPARLYIGKSKRRLVSKRRPDVKALDALCRSIVMLRDRGRCAWCGKTGNLQWCHVHTRRVHSLRWRLENSMMLCAGHHLHWHHHPMEAATWWSQTYPERMRVLTMMRQTKDKPDLAAIQLYLEAEQRKLERAGPTGRATDAGSAGASAGPPAHQPQGG